MSYYGDIAEDATIRVGFNTNAADGTPTTLSGTPAISIYKQGSTTESTAGVTLTVDYDSRTGYNVVVIDTSADAFYETGKDYQVVITTGTVDSVSVVGVVVASFSIENRPASTGGAPSAADVADAVWDEALSGHTTAGTAGKQLADAASAGDPWATALPGSYTSGQAGYIIGNSIPAILTDTNELQTDWTNGGRLDLILDDILADTAVIGAAGAGLTAIPWNAAWDAEVQSECTDALNAYDPPTNTEMTAAFTEIKGAGWDSGTDTLEHIRDAITAVPGLVWDEATSGHVTVGTFGEALGAFDADTLAQAVWNVDTDNIVAAGSIGVLNIGKLSLITAQGVLLASIVSDGDVIDIYKGRTKTITFTIPTASIDLSGHTAKFGMTRISGTTGTASLEVVGTLTNVGDDYHLEFNLTTVQTAALEPSPTVVNPYRTTASEAYSYRWSISATDDADSCPQLARGLANVLPSDTTCTVPE